MVVLRVPLDLNVHKDFSTGYLLTTFLVCQISLVVNVVEGCKLIEDVYLIGEKNCLQKNFYIGESGNWIITN